MTNLNLHQILGIAIISLVIIADVTFASSRARLNLSSAIQSAARSFQRKLRWIAGESILSIRFLLCASLVISAILVLCLFVGGVLTDEQMRSKLNWIFPTTLCAGVLSTILSHIVVNRLSTKAPRLSTVALWLLLCILTPVLLWLAVMHFGTWLDWRNTSSPLAYASEWFYAEVYDDYFRDSVGLFITTAIAAAISLPIVVPIVLITIQTIKEITNLKRGVLSIFVVILFSTTLLLL